ncbi:hypothetical protein MMF93_09445 [Streptomyces tubbatahanensis]|uniref:Secreted protein n=1 Tax=Streptomyces tubbatahanensis TaxID=2923272 RepID=A0ABY3XQT3_9ACTN|nr:hypothetical protein [Streptomyces tubbatahanensis]UNS96714.1 hypothetical protein MMF93_09445 [Streptomyces tubbatahanensis]
MRSRSVRLAVTASAVALLGGLAAAAPAAAAPQHTTAGTSSVGQAAAWEFVAWYPNKTQCQTGGAYYQRHGYSNYICQLDPMRGWALMVQE